jgi:hypothetical protein
MRQPHAKAIANRRQTSRGWTYTFLNGRFSTSLSAVPLPALPEPMTDPIRRRARMPVPAHEVVGDLFATTVPSRATRR